MLVFFSSSIQRQWRNGQRMQEILQSFDRDDSRETKIFHYPLRQHSSVQKLSFFVYYDQCLLCIRGFTISENAKIIIGQ